MERSAAKIITILRENGHEAYFAGGCVRDLLLGLPAKDIDIATSARPEEVLALFRRTRKVGAHFGVVLVKINKHEFEVATFRADGPYSDGRRPDHVTFTDAENDVQRRDFTINGLLYDPLQEQVLDLVGGRQDLEQRLIRAIGDPNQRFAEDALRLLRAIRFAVRYDFEIEPNTLAAIGANAQMIERVSHERIHNELVKILATADAVRGWKLLWETGLMRLIFPLVDAVQNETIERRLRYQPAEKPLTALAAIFLDVANSKQINTIGREYRFSKTEIAVVSELIEQHPKFLRYNELQLHQKRRLLRSALIDEHLILLGADLAARGLPDPPLVAAKLDLEQTPHAALHPDPLLTGHDLIGLQIPKGAIYKEILQRLEDAQLAGQITERSEAIALAQSIAREQL